MQSCFMHSRGMPTIAPPRPSKLDDTKSLEKIGLTAWREVSFAAIFKAQVLDFVNYVPDRLPYCFKGVWGEICVDPVIAVYLALDSVPAFSPTSLGCIVLLRLVVRQQETRPIIATCAWASNAWLLEYRYGSIPTSLHDIRAVSRCKEKADVKHGMD